MRFAFTDDQRDLIAGARELFAGESTPAVVRAAWESEHGLDRRLWKAMADLGLVGLTVPEEHGGLGLDEVDLVGILEEAGRAIVPAPLLETTAVAVPLLVEAGTPEQQAAWLPRIAVGEAVAAVRLGGEPLVVAADVADVLLLEVDGALHAVPRDRVRLVAQPSIDPSRRLFAVEADVDASTRMEGGDAEAARAFERGAAGTAALLDGIGARLVELSVAFALEREQFGRPVGSFQAVKHLLAETVLRTETARAASWYAAYAIAHDQPDLEEAVSIAKSNSTDAERLANTNALQVHAGIGFTWEHDLHLWLKRGKALEGTYGTASWHRARIAGRILGAAGGERHRALSAERR